MIKIAFLLSLLLLSAAPAPLPFNARVIKVADGDTFTVVDSSKVQYKIRLYGVDCPEKKQSFGEKAMDLTVDLVVDKEVKIIPKATDMYGRIVAEVILPDDRNLSRELVKAGLAWWYRQYAKEDKELADLEVEAKHIKKGLWSEGNPTPPWVYRKERR